MKPSAINVFEFESVLEHYRSGRDDEEACTDLLTDAMHFMAFNFLNISTVLQRARMHFDAEAAVVTDESVGVGHHRQIIGTYAVYQLAHDEAAYGPDAGKFIVTSADHEREFSAPMSKADAEAFATALNACTMVVDRWEKGDLAEAARALPVGDCQRDREGSMSTTRHSPAPWSYEYSPYTVRNPGTHGTKHVGDDISAFEVFDADGTKVFDTNENTPAELQEANARLGSTAPRLLAALIVCAELLADHDEAEGEEGDAYREALVAIAEATGRPS